MFKVFGSLFLFISLLGCSSIIGDNIVGDAQNKAAAIAENTIDSIIPNSKTEVIISGVSKGKPQFDISNTTGFGESSDGNSINFLQSSFVSMGNRETINLGLGRRYLSDDEKYLFGVNSFFDIDPEHNHQRLSIGGEIKSSSIELTGNSYFGVTGWKTGANGNTERVLDGYDIELGAQIPYIPAAKLYVKQFQWNLYDATNLEGLTYSLKFASPSNSGLSLEIGENDYKGSKTDQSFAKLTYSIPLGEKKQSTTMKIISDQIFENESMKENMLDKVRRQNTIVVQTKFTSSVGGI